MKVAIGWDGSEEGLDALRLGSDLVAQLGGELIVVCVIEPEMLRAELTADREELISTISDRYAVARQALGGAEFTFRESIKAPVESLRGTAIETGADLLVLGSTHLGPLGRVWPGSVAERLESDAPCPIVVAPAGYAQRRVHPGLSVIGVAYDGSRQSREAVALASRLAELVSAEVEVLSVAPGYAVADVPLGPLEALRGETSRRVDRGLARLAKGVKGHGEVLEGATAAVLEERGVELDLLVIGSRGRGPLRSRLLGSVSADVIRTIPCPVIVVPENSTAGMATRERASSS
jgi:nucleotide-binding universal stress UspA family protein